MVDQRGKLFKCFWRGNVAQAYREDKNIVAITAAMPEGTGL